MGRAAIIALVALIGSGCSRQPTIIVGSKNFTEQLVLGEIIAQQIERRMDVPVDRRLNLGGTLLAHQALIRGAIHLYPEYTGTALTAVLKQPVHSDPAAVFEKVRAEYASRWQLKWLPGLGFNNTFAMVVRRDAGVATLSEAAAARSWRLGAGHEFLQRADGLDGLVRTYGLKIDGAPVVMDLGLLYQALGAGKVDMAAGSSTDGLLSVLKVEALADDKRYFPPYECAIIVREQALAEFPGLQGALEELSGKLTEPIMRKLNHAVDGSHRQPSEVAAEYLKSIQ
jgi:glycine betaine/choline ABC-type transport system substrate-binding protein